MDFSTLSDKQLTELIGAAVTEATKRGEAAIRAVDDVVWKVAEKTTTARQVNAEKRRQETIWARKKHIALMVIGALGKWWTVNVRIRDSDKRVYLDQQGMGRKIEYYVTGTYSHPPGHVVVEGTDKDAIDCIRKLCEYIADAHWLTDRIDCDVAATAQVEPIGTIPGEVQRYIDVRAAREQLRVLQRQELDRQAAQRVAQV